LAKHIRGRSNNCLAAQDSGYLVGQGIAAAKMTGEQGHGKLSLLITDYNGRILPLINQ
jgi:hypothetical protein